MPRLFVLLLAAVALLIAACGGDDGDGTARDTGAAGTATAAPANDIVTQSPSPAPPPPPAGEAPLYLALGDSLSAGIGASDRSTRGWVGLVHAALPGWELLNLGVPGDDSRELLEEGPLREGLAAIEAREQDTREGNEVAVITLEIGGNDLLDIYFDLVIPGDCPSLAEALEREVCVNALRDALADFRANLAEALRQLGEAAPDTPLFLMTLYNPFSGGSTVIDEIGVLALEGLPDTPFPEGLNDVIREVGAEAGVTVVEWYELFLNKQSEYIAQDLIHPNDTGHAVMAEAVIAAMAQAGLPVVD